MHPCFFFSLCIAIVLMFRCRVHVASFFLLLALQEAGAGSASCREAAQGSQVVEACVAAALTGTQG